MSFLQFNNNYCRLYLEIETQSFLKEQKAKLFWIKNSYNANMHTFHITTHKNRMKQIQIWYKIQSNPVSHTVLHSFLPKSFYFLYLFFFFVFLFFLVSIISHFTWFKKGFGWGEMRAGLRFLQIIYWIKVFFYKNCPFWQVILGMYGFNGFCRQNNISMSFAKFWIRLINVKA